MENDGWKEYQKLVLNELERNYREIESVKRKVNEIHIEIATLKIKSGVWGVMGSSIPVICFVLWETFKTNVGS